MIFNIILVTMGYIIFFSCPILFTRYKDYKRTLKHAVSMSLIGLSVTTNLKANMEIVYLKNRYLVRQHIATVAKYVGFSLAYILPFFTFSMPDEPLIGVLLLRILLGTMNIAVGSIFYMVSDVLNYNREPKVEVSHEELLSVYFKKEYPTLQSFLIPIYTHIGVTDSRHIFAYVNLKNKYESYNSDIYRTKNYLSRFGHNLFLFTTIFEKAILDESSKALFNAEISKIENIEVLAKLIVFLEDPALIKQLINETNNESATIFNDSLEKMVSELDKSMKKNQIEDEKLQVVQSKLDEQIAKERLDLLVKQSFILIK